MISITRHNFTIFRISNLFVLSFFQLDGKGIQTNNRLALKQPQQALDVILSFRPDILCGKTSSLQGKNESQQETNMQEET